MKICSGLFAFAILIAVTNVAFAIQGDPIPGVDVSIEQRPPVQIIATSKSDDSGRFSFKRIPAGKFQLVLNRIEPKPTGSNDTSAKYNHNHNSAKSNTAGIVVSISNGS